MATYRKPKHVSRLHQKKTTKEELDLLPLPALAGLTFGFFFFFLSAEIGFYNRPHPLHWMTAAGGASLTYLMGLFYARRKTTH